MLLVVIFVVYLACFVGNIVALKIQASTGMQTKWMIFSCLMIYTFLCSWGLLGLIPSSPIGMKHVWESFMFGCLHG